jgi:CspA family cold shock protein
MGATGQDPAASGQSPNAGRRQANNAAGFLVAISRQGACPDLGTAPDPLPNNIKGQTMRQTGTVKFFNSAKGYGFITPDDGDKDVFVHVTAVERSGLGTLADGQRVSFETEPDKRGKGPKAVELQPAS